MKTKPTLNRNSIIELEVLKCRGCRENGFQWLEFTKGPATDKAQLASCTDRCTAILNVGEESREKEKGADRRAVWRIGAQSEGVEKSLHLNAPLHPNNSSAAKKKKQSKKKTPYALSFPSFLCFTLYPSSCEGHTPGCHPSGCACARVRTDVNLFKEVLRWVSGVDCSHCQYCSCGFGCHGNNYAHTVQSGQSQYCRTALKPPMERNRDRTAFSSYLLNINMCVGKANGKHSHFLNICC